MKRLLAILLMISLVSVSLSGCAEKSLTTKQETKVSTPGGTTTITTEREVTKTGEDPPTARP